MKKSWSFSVLSTLGLLLAFACYTVAQQRYNTAGDVAIERLRQLSSELTARGETNTLAKVISLIAAQDVLKQTADASTTAAILRVLRSGDTNAAIRLLEGRLDGALIQLGSVPREEIREAQLQTLKAVKDYGAKYPASKGDAVTDAAVARAFELLEKQ